MERSLTKDEIHYDGKIANQSHHLSHLTGAVTDRDSCVPSGPRSRTNKTGQRNTPTAKFSALSSNTASQKKDFIRPRVSPPALSPAQSPNYRTKQQTDGSGSQTFGKRPNVTTTNNLQQDYFQSQDMDSIVPYSTVPMGMEATGTVMPMDHQDVINAIQTLSEHFGLGDGHRGVDTRYTHESLAFPAGTTLQCK